MKRLLKFDDDGFYIEEEIVEDDHEVQSNEYLVDLSESLVFHKPKLVEGKIVEGKTDDEFFEEQLISSLNPTPEEVAEAEFEIRLINKLIEWEMF